MASTHAEFRLICPWTSVSHGIPCCPEYNCRRQHQTFGGCQGLIAKSSCESGSGMLCSMAAGALHADGDISIVNSDLNVSGATATGRGGAVVMPETWHLVSGVVKGALSSNASIHFKKSNVSIFGSSATLGGGASCHPHQSVERVCKVCELDHPCRTASRSAACRS